MATVTVPRELSGRVEHPEWLHIGWGVSGAHQLHRCDHECVGPLTSGSPTLGWAGDPRLAVYLDTDLGRYLLVRLEGDESYRLVMAAPKFVVLNDEWVNRLIRKLQSIDSRTGTPHGRVDAHNARVQAARTAAWDDRVENDLSDRLRFALKKDKADYYC